MSVLGPRTGIRPGWRPATFAAADVLDFIRQSGEWINLDGRGQPVEWRGWRHKGLIKRIDVAFENGSTISVRRLANNRQSIHLSRWAA